jgi:uncharacterized protein YutE (UPF0331/DUF86 family)
MLVRFVLFDLSAVQAYRNAVEKLERAGTIPPEMIERESL